MKYIVTVPFLTAHDESSKDMEVEFRLDTEDDKNISLRAKYEAKKTLNKLKIKFIEVLEPTKIKKDDK